MTYPILNSIFFTAIVGVSFVYPILENANKKVFGNIVKASTLVNEEPVFNVNKESQYIVKSKLPINKNVISAKKVLNFNDFELTATSGIIMDLKTKDLLYGLRVDQKVPIASITKLMSALVFLEENPNFNNIYKVKPSDRRNGGRIYIYTGEKLKIKDLFNISLVSSANTATIAMISSIGLNENEFVLKMNNKAKSLGLNNTIFVDATGLSESNLSTARDIAKLTRVALSNSKIISAVSQKNYKFSLSSGKNRSISSTNDLLENFESTKIDLIGGKTGFNRLAGYCLVAKFLNKNGNEVISVVMGAKEKQDRFMLTEKMVKWVYNNYTWR